jgi:hypothetical protein
MARAPIRSLDIRRPEKALGQYRCDEVGYELLRLE